MALAYTICAQYVSPWIMVTLFLVEVVGEIVGRVIQVGSAVTRFRAGDLVGVGCLVDSDGTCRNCQEGLEQFAVLRQK